MKKSFLALMALAALMFTSCLKSDLYQGAGEEEQEGFNEFEFSTTKEVMLQLNYRNMGIKASVYFEVYDQMPVDVNGNSYLKKENILPIYTNDTDSEGAFSEKITLPAYVQTLYIYSPAFYARTLIEAKVVNGVITASDAYTGGTTTRNVTTRAISYTTTVIEKYGWKTYLGDFSPLTGKITAWTDANGTHPGYAYLGNDPKLSFSPEETAELYEAQSAVIQVGKSCPEQFRSNYDLLIEKETEVSLSLLGGNTCWGSSMGYYYYEVGHKPQTLSEANVILIFPNTQDGKWNQWAGFGGNNSPERIGLDRGTVVQLVYYPNIENNSKEGATTTFPKNYRIGFVLATNTWTNSIRSGSKECLAATSAGLSIVAGQSVEVPRSAVFRYNNGKTNSLILSFEDHNDDQNFSDVVFSLKTNPADAIGEIPDSDGKKTIKELKGVYAFEDLWPNKGDFDMNDALIVSNYEKTYDSKGIYKEAYELTAYQNIANNINGLGVKIINGGSGKISLSVDGQPLKYTKLDGDVLLITDNIKLHLGKKLKVNIEYSGATDKKNAEIQPFIWKEGTNGKIWEVHIAKESPTHLVDTSFFGQADDASVPNENIYYVRNGNYPFAFYLAGATEEDINKLLDKANEGRSIEAVYPKYNGWSVSGGVDSSNWYKE